jgi:hypothetical protein
MMYNTWDYWVLGLYPFSEYSEEHEWLRSALSKGLNRTESPTLSSENGNRSSFRNVVFFLNTGRYTKSKNPVIPMGG